MTARETYSVHKGTSREDLDRMAADIFGHGKITGVTRCECRSCFEVKRDGFPVIYYVHLSGFRVAEVIEEVSK
jgi:hypothetical protein